MPVACSIPGFHRRSGGFTLIELFVVLVIVGILVSYALPGFSNLVAQAKLDSSVEKLSRTITTARNLALNTNDTQSVVICPSTNPEADAPTCAANTVTNYHTGWLVFIECDNDRILDYVAEVNCDESTEDPVVLDGNDVEQLLRVQSAFSDITLEAASATRIEFDRSGRPVNSVQIDVKKGGATYASVTMNNLGVVTTTYVEDFF